MADSSRGGVGRRGFHQENRTKGAAFPERDGGRSTGRRPWRPAALAALSWFAPGGALWAQTEPVRTEAEFVATVTDPQASAQRVRVAINRTVIINTSLPVSQVTLTGENIVRVEPMTATQFMVTGQTFGVAHVSVWTEGGQRHIFEVSVELDLELLNATFKDLDPQSDARATSVMGNVLLVGSVSSSDVAKRMEEIANLYISRLATKAVVQNHLRVAGEQQVLLKCTVAEVSRTAVRELGINGFLAGENFGDGFVVNQVGGINPFNIQAAPTIDAQLPIPFITGDNPLGGASTLSLGFPDLQMQLFIRALADNTLLKILAEPTLVAVSGETASFLAGGEFPVPIPQGGSAAGAITIEFKEFGVNLSFTPLVLPHQRIRLQVRPEVSTRDETGGLVTASGFVPAITTRRTQTTVEVASGATLAIAGLLRDEVRGIASRVPGIGDLPVLGALFRSVDYQRSRTELVILVTPEIVAPMHPSQVPEIPGQRITDPTDLDLFLLGALEGPDYVDDIELEDTGEEGADAGSEQTSRRSEPERLPLHGPWGFAALKSP